MRKIPSKIRKRDGEVVAFEPGKITQAIFRAGAEVLPDQRRAGEIADAVTAAVLSGLGRRAGTPTIEAIQDMVEEALIDQGCAAVAKRYILYRKAHQDLRDTKTTAGVQDDLKLPVNALLVLKNRYLQKDDRGVVIETPGEMFRRVARSVSRAESRYGPPAAARDAEAAFYSLMTSGDFLPNSPTLMNAGTSIGQLSACFVLPVEDSLESIFETVKNTALIHRTGGGTGFSFSRIRPRGELVSTTKGRASGPISFMSIFNQTTDVIIQGGRRRGANMGILRCDHPDIFEFVEAKLDPSAMANFNLSVAVTDRFMQAVRNDALFPLLSPASGKTVRTVKARALFDLICFSAWRTGDPGLIFIDEINRRNPTPALGPIEATNPCSEVLLLPYESCNLASINLAVMVGNGRPDWRKLRRAIRLGVRFLDNVIDINRFPLPQIRDITRANRKIGLGVMGFADMLIRLDIPYTDERAVALADRVMKFIRRESLQASRDLARERGAFPNFADSIHARRGPQLRNATVNAIAPTGTISIIAGCSSGIEPLFSLSYTRTVMGGTKLFEFNPLLEEALQSRGLFSRQLMARIRREGGIQSVDDLPEDLRHRFTTALDVPPAQHLRIQAAFQKHTDNSVSKTINLPADATVADVRDIYLSAHVLRCKGITIYRYGSRSGQVLSVGTDGEDDEPVDGPDPTAGACPSGMCSY